MSDKAWFTTSSIHPDDYKKVRDHLTRRPNNKYLSIAPEIVYETPAGEKMNCNVIQGFVAGCMGVEFMGMDYEFADITLTHHITFIFINECNEITVCEVGPGNTDFVFPEILMDIEGTAHTPQGRYMAQSTMMREHGMRGDS